jgi:hypothetical protein
VKDPLDLDIPIIDSPFPTDPAPSPNGHRPQSPAPQRPPAQGQPRPPHHAPARAASQPPQGQTQQGPQAPPARARATRGFNVLIWRGRLASQPEVMTAPSGTRYLRIRCLQDQPDRNGQPSTQGIEIALFNERAEQFAAFFRKGDEVLVRGRLTIETRHDQHGTVHTTISLHPDGPIELLHRPQAPARSGAGPETETAP